MRRIYTHQKAVSAHETAFSFLDAELIMVSLAYYSYFYTNAVYKTHQNRAEAIPGFTNLLAHCNCGMAIYGLEQ